MAAEYAFEAKQDPLVRTVFIYRFSGIFRATREKTTAAPKDRADCVFIDTDQCQQQQFHRLIVQVRSIFPADSGFHQPELAGRVSLVWSSSAISDRARVTDNATCESSLEPDAGSDSDLLLASEVVWQQPIPSGHPLLHQLSEGGNVTGNENSLTPS